jgi:hypothetical protein
MPNKSITFYSETLPNRLVYTAELVFQDLLGLTLVFTNDKNKFISTKLPKINYSEGPLSTPSNRGEFFVKSEPLLFESQVSKKNIDADFSIWVHQSPLQFDFLAAIFLLVSRYEEYVLEPVLFDHHQRFPATASLASKFGFLRKPIVNQWVMGIGVHLKTLFPTLELTFPSYSFQPSFDIDMPWKYKNKGLLRMIGGLAKDILSGDFSELKNRIKILRGVKPDPDFTFDYIFDEHKRLNCPPIFFLLLGDYGEFDKNPNETNKPFQDLIRFVSTHYQVGLHPSYRSNFGLTILEKEKARFERMTNLPLEISRQHFLKLRFPETYQNLLSIGITADYSMGYADDIGFRASIATPFRWFDLAKNEQTDLWIYPFQAMDVTLKDYLKLTPNEAIEQVNTLISETKAVGGTFTPLWHNSSFSDTEGWQGWREVYENMAKTAQKK